MYNKKTLIIILNWNGSQDTIDCCVSLSKSAEIANDNTSVLIIDNNSNAESLIKLKCGLESCFGSSNYLNLDEDISHEYNLSSYCSFGTFSLICSNVNHGFARGCNLGAKLANKLKYEYILFLNNDTVVERDFLKPLLTMIKDNDAVIPQIRYFHDKNLIWNCGGEINIFGSRKYYFAGDNANEIEVPKFPFRITFATGCCILFRTDYFLKSGLFSERFFFGEEDIDYALRLKKIKAKIFCVTQSIIYHKVGASLAGDLTKLRRKAFIHFLNRFINMKKHLGLFWPIWIIPAIFKMIVNLKVIYKLSFFQTIAFSYKILTNAIIKSRVEKSYFEKIMNEGY